LELYWTPFDEAGGSGKAHRIPTGLGENEVECSPCVSRDGNGLRLSFIATSGHGTGRLTHHLYQARGTSLDGLEHPRRVSDTPCFAGFARRDLVAMADGNDGLIRLDGRIRERLETDFEQIARISFCYDQPAHLLITGISIFDRLRERASAKHSTIVYDVEQRQVIGQLQRDGRRLYKPTVCGGSLVCAAEQHHAQEGWKLQATDRFQTNPCEHRVRAKPQR